MSSTTKREEINDPTWEAISAFAHWAANDYVYDPSEKPPFMLIDRSTWCRQPDGSLVPGTKDILFAHTRLHAALKAANPGLFTAATEAARKIHVSAPTTGGWSATRLRVRHSSSMTWL
jgi:hypothetical protein